MATQKDRIVTFLRTQGTLGARTWRIAAETGAPQASVRRNIQELIAAGHNIVRSGSRWVAAQ